MLGEGNFWAVTTKLRLKQTPMTLFSSQTSDSFHFLNNKAFLWNEVTASICQVDISTSPLGFLKSVADEGWPAEPAERQQSPFCLGRDKLPRDRRGEEPLCHHHTNSAGSLIPEQPGASSTHRTSQRVKRSGERLRMAQGQAGGSRTGATRPAAHDGWVMSRECGI